MRARAAVCAGLRLSSPVKEPPTEPPRRPCSKQNRCDAGPLVRLARRARRTPCRRLSLERQAGNQRSGETASARSCDPRGVCSARIRATELQPARRTSPRPGPQDSSQSAPPAERRRGRRRPSGPAEAGPGRSAAPGRRPPPARTGGLARARRRRRAAPASAHAGAAAVTG